MKTMEELFNKLNSKFTAYNWNKVSRNDETAEKIKQEILEIISTLVDKPAKPEIVVNHISDSLKNNSKAY